MENKVIHYEYDVRKNFDPRRAFDDSSLVLDAKLPRVRNPRRSLAENRFAVKKLKELGVWKETSVDLPRWEPARKEIDPSRGLCHWDKEGPFAYEVYNNSTGEYELEPSHFSRVLFTTDEPDLYVVKDVHSGKPSHDYIQVVSLLRIGLDELNGIFKASGK